MAAIAKHHLASLKSFISQKRLWTISNCSWNCLTMVGCGSVTLECSTFRKQLTPEGLKVLFEHHLANWPLSMTASFHKCLSFPPRVHVSVPCPPLWTHSVDLRTSGDRNSSSGHFKKPRDKTPRDISTVVCPETCRKAETGWTILSSPCFQHQTSL